MENNRKKQNWKQKMTFEILLRKKFQKAKKGKKVL